MSFEVQKLDSPVQKEKCHVCSVSCTQLVRLTIKQLADLFSFVSFLLFHHRIDNFTICGITCIF